MQQVLNNFESQTNLRDVKVCVEKAVRDGLSRNLVIRELIDELLAAGPDSINSVANLYERLIADDGIGSVYTPSSYSELIAESAIATKVASDLSITSERASSILFGIKSKQSNRALRGKIHERLLSLRFVDPACGAGALLLAAAKVLEIGLTNTSQCRQEVDAASARKRIIAQLFGRDIDETAIKIARARLAEWAGSSTKKKDRERIAVKDSLGEKSSDAKFDICLLNPPYVPTYSRQSDPRVAKTVNRYAKQEGLSGRQNLFGCFLHMITGLIKQNGVATIIVPDTFASASSFGALRQLWRLRFDSLQWLHIDGRVFRAQVGSVIVTGSPELIGEKRTTAIRLEVGVNDKTPLVTEETNEGDFYFFRSPFERDIWQSINRLDARYQDFVDIRDGVNTGPRYIRELILDPKRATSTTRPLVEGENIASDGFILKRPQRTINYDETLIDAAARKAGASLRDPSIFDDPKVMTRQTADTLIAAVENRGGIVAINSVHCHRFIDGNSSLLWGLSAYLNAPLVRLYYALDGGEQRPILPQVRIAWLRTMPVPANFLNILQSLNSLGRKLANPKTRDRGGSIVAIHDLVCDALGLGAKSKQILDCYCERFPRFATNLPFQPNVDAA